MKRLQQQWKVRAIMWALGSVMVALVLAACGSSSTTATSTASPTSATSSTPATTGSSSASATTGSSSGASGGQAKAQAIVSTLEQPVAFTVPSVGAHVPTGKSVVLITCTLPICQSTTNVAAAKLHWTFHEIQWDPSKGPQAYVAAFQQALSLKPSGIITIGIFPPAIVSSEMAQAASGHIPVVSVTGLSNNPAIKSCINCAEYLGLVGKRIVDVAVAAGATGSSIVSLGDPGNVGTAQSNAGVQAELASLGEGKAAELDLSLQHSPAANDSAVVNYVESHPGTKAIVNTLADLTTGLPAALAQAGLASKVKYYVSGPQTPDIADLKAGTEGPAIAIADDAAGWDAMNSLVLLFLGKSAPLDASGWVAVMTKSNAAAMLQAGGVSERPEPPHYQSTYLHAWGVS